MTATEGTVEFDVPAAGKPCQTWYRIVGDLGCGITPLIAVHGGPGLTHHYMLPMVDFYEKLGIPVVFYDQLGNGLSTHLPEKFGDESFWNESLFHAELLNLIAKLNLQTYDLIGQSWGGMMSSTFASKQPKGLRKLVLSNAPARDEDWVASYNHYRRGMPQEVQDTLQKHEAAGTTESKEYEEMMLIFFKKHMMRIIPFPEDFQTSFTWGEKDTTVTLTMLGPSEWAVTGTLRDWTSVPMIKNIAVPTLVINGVHEGASDEAIKPFLEMIPDVKWVKLKDSTHCPHWEERDNYIQTVGKWLMTK